MSSADYVNLTDMELKFEIKEVTSFLWIEYQESNTLFHLRL